MARWLVDGNNVMGSRPDGWWRDRVAGMQRVVDELEDHVRATGDEVVVVFDGRARDLRATRVAVAFAPDADDEIARRAGPGLTVVTSDRELRARAGAAGAEVAGARALTGRNR